MTEERPSRQLDKVIIRLPDGVRDRLAVLAKANKRSVNAEAIAAFEAWLSEQEKIRAHKGPSEALAWNREQAAAYKAQGEPRVGVVDGGLPVTTSPEILELANRLGQRVAEEVLTELERARVERAGKPDIDISRTDKPE